MAKLREDCLFRIESGGTPNTTIRDYWDGNISWATLVDLHEEGISIITNTKRKIIELGLTNSSAKIIPEESVIVSTRATIGKV